MGSCDMDTASGKAIRIFTQNGVEKVVAAVGTGSAILILDASTGAEIAYRKMANKDGGAMDVEISRDQNGNVDGFVTTGLDHKTINQDGTDGCPSIRVRHSLAQNDSSHRWVHPSSFTLKFVTSVF